MMREQKTKDQAQQAAAQQEAAARLIATVKGLNDITLLPPAPAKPIVPPKPPVMAAAEKTFLPPEYKTFAALAAAITDAAWARNTAKVDELVNFWLIHVKKIQATLQELAPQSTQALKEFSEAIEEPLADTIKIMAQRGNTDDVAILVGIWQSRSELLEETLKQALEIEMMKRMKRDITREFIDALSPKKQEIDYKILKKDPYWAEDRNYIRDKDRGLKDPYRKKRDWPYSI